MDKKTYDVAEGVSWVNGDPTPKNRQVDLSDAEAQYDLGLGRILRANTVAKPQSKPAS